jgi:hypothetical protein
MMATERELAAAAGALIGECTDLCEAERELIPPETIPERLKATLCGEILAGGDPLGEAFRAIRAPERRRRMGATYTPPAIVAAMIEWAKGAKTQPVRIVDPGSGSGRFILAAGRAFPKATLVAVEIDPLASLITRANAAALELDKRLTILLQDYRAIDLPEVNGPTLFIGNPPYVRHHGIEKHWKAWLTQTTRTLGLSASGLAGLHVHFFVKTRQLARAGDFGAFITAAEWMDVNYGSVLRKMLADGLGGAALHVISPTALPFADALATGVITCFRVGSRPDQLMVRAVDSLDKLHPLSEGKAVIWKEVEGVSRWSNLLRATPRPRHGEIEVGELFRVHRGQVTGCNAVWIYSEHGAGVPSRFLYPSITKARDLIAAGDHLRSSRHLRAVIDLPVDLSQLSPDEREAVARFLKWATASKADKTFIATHRRAWWSVGLRSAADSLHLHGKARACIRTQSCGRPAPQHCARPLPRRTALCGGPGRDCGTSTRNRQHVGRPYLCGWPYQVRARGGRPATHPRTLLAFGMTVPNIALTPAVWTDEQLEADAQKALEEFVDRRLAEPGGKYLAHVNSRRKAMIRLFKALAGVDPTSPDAAMVREVLLNNELFDALRYVTGPPVSEDDLGVLVTRNIRGMKKAEIKKSDSVVADALS